MNEAFLSGGGEMGARMRAHDWAATELGPPASWPQGLRVSLRLMLNTSHPVYVFWGAHSLCFYNDAYARSLGPERHPGSLGQPGRDVWAEIWGVIGPQIEQVMSGRGATWHENQLIAITRHGRREDAYWTYSYGPIDEERAPNGVGGVLVLVSETTRAVQMQAHQTFLAELGATLQSICEPRDVLKAALCSLGAHLRADRVGYGEVVDEATIHLTTPYAAGLPALDGEHALTGFAATPAACSGQEITISSNDVTCDPAAGDDVWACLDTRAFVSARLVRAGEFVASLFVNQRVPRQWSQDEIQLIEAVASRIWDALERAKAEAALRASDARFRAALEVTGVLWTNDAHGRMAGEQAGWAALTGQAQSEYQGFGWAAAVHPDDAVPTVDAWNEAVARRGMFIFEHRVRVRDGQYRNFLVRAAPVLAEDGAIHEWVGVHVDITDQRAAEHQLRELNATLEMRVRERTRERNRIWTNARDLLVTLGTDGIVHEMSPSFTKLLGYEVKDAVGRSIMEFIVADDVDPSGEALRTAGDGINLDGFINRYRHVDGSLRWISWYTSTEDDTVYAYGRDITDEHEQMAALRRAEDQLRQSQKMEAVGQLTGGLAHDFNNLLAGVTGSLEMIEARMAQGRNAEVGRYVLAAQGAARRAAALTQRLLAFSRRQTLDPISVNANRLIAGMDDLIRRAIGPSVELEIIGASSLWPCRVDANQLENALLNLCINARDAMPHGGRLTIETHNKFFDSRAAAEQDLPVGQYVSLCVTDTGTGMTAEVKARAFDPFFTTKPLGEGTGLGLSMIYGFVRQSGGQIRIYTELGHGTTMCLYLPRSDKAAAELAEAIPARDDRSAPAGQTVLVVDDEPTIRMLVADVLEDAGLQTIEAADGAAALRILQSSTKLDLLITDVGLPGGMNGRQVADAGRALRPELKVLFITGYAENAVVGNGHLDPWMAILTKPFTMEALATRIRGMIEKK